MKQEVLITVHSTFRAGGEVEKTEFFTNGLLYLKNKKYYLLYEMYDQEQPAGKTSIIVENPHKVSPVSYTHLDKKTQPGTRLRFLMFRTKTT